MQGFRAGDDGVARVHVGASTALPFDWTWRSVLPVHTTAESSAIWTSNDQHKQK